MKRFMTVLAAFALLAAGTAFAADDYKWDGSGNNRWKVIGNWTWISGSASTVDYPGYDENADSATIDETYETPPVIVNVPSALSYTLYDLILKDGASSSYSVTLNVSDSGGAGDENETFITVTHEMIVGHGSAENTESYVELTGEDRIEVTGSLVIQGGQTDQPTTLEVSGGGSLVTN